MGRSLFFARRECAGLVPAVKNAVTLCLIPATHGQRAHAAVYVPFAVVVALAPTVTRQRDGVLVDSRR